MVCLRQQSASARVWELASSQHGVVSVRQLHGLGFGRRAIQHRVARGRLHRVIRDVYAIGRPELTRHGRWMAAVLCCGSDVVLSHRSAAALYGFGAESRDRIEVSSRSLSYIRRSGIRVHRRPALRPDDLGSHCGVPVTSPVCTLLDIATQLDSARLERAVNEADRLELIDSESLQETVEGHRGQPGVARLRTLLNRRTFRLTDSELERRFLPLVDAVGLPRPLTRQHLNGFRVDFFWPDLGFVVETDGLRYHRTPAQQARDRLRDQAHTAAGMTPLRFTHEQVRFEPDYVRETLSAVARRLAAQ